MGSLQALIEARLDNLLAQGPAGPAPSFSQAAGTASAAIASYTAVEAVLAAEEAVLAAELAAQLVAGGQPNDPLHLQDGIEALAKQLIETAETVETMTQATTQVFGELP